MVFLSPAAIILSAIAAIGIAYFNWTAAKKAAKTKSTFDTLRARAWDQDYITARALFIAAQNVAPENQENGTTNQQNNVLEAIQKDRMVTEQGEVNQNKMTTESAVRLIMNDYEMICIAIESEVLDVEFVKEWHLNTFIKDYDLTKSYVQWMRSKNENEAIYAVFQRVAEKWKAERQPNA